MSNRQLSSVPSAARRAAELMAMLCSSAATDWHRRELALLVATERITLADFTFALSELTDERGAAAYDWEQGPALPGHDWRLAHAREIRRDGESVLDVQLSCARCGSVAAFTGGAVPPCEPGQHWQWTGKGWQRAEEKGHG